MEESTLKPDTTEEELLLWRSRELLLTTRVLKNQLNTAKQARGETLKISQSTTESIQSTEEDIEHRIQISHEQALERKQSRLDQLNSKISFAKSQISQRSKQMINELWKIYPIIEFPDRKGYSICDIHLPSSDNFEGHDETMVSVAIGYVGHLLLLLSDILDITLRFPLRHHGSRSLIYCNRKNLWFQLYVDSFKSREWSNFSYGINLLNLNIVQIRTLYGLHTNDSEDTLGNLHGLKLMLDAGN